jgi:diguanylate cyclase (GGDEF)-like protein
MGELVLVADDDEAIRGLVTLNLTAHGHEVITARDGEETLRLVRERRPALVLLDVMMPGMDGYEVCERIRSDPRTRDVAVIMLTARSLSTDKVVGLTAGADDYVLKPFDPLELVARVRSTLRRAREMRALSPLTALPGNLQIEEEICRRFAAGEAFAVCHIDLDGFKAYNDRYGFLRGDEVIARTADLLREASRDLPRAFLGHVGGDDFVLVCDAQRAEEVCRRATEAFDRIAPGFYDDRDAARGWIEVEDRRGQVVRHPLLTMSIGVGVNRPGFRDHRRVVDAATEMKAYAKREPGSVYAIDRRRSP